ncbi:hypothetical protein [Enterobacter cloacae complex sp. P31C]|uniref:hypothetical protein n=1 Tax=Enterobacter TaxID=547 RepID=UPI0014198E4E|nr:hypothetical protein [Enterobacter cloacae complex sp. P31C]MBE3287899.1 hypothetical protein [Enterobacter cloacae complex sp. P31C]NIH42665.1 hypothetical protein [Enterobacter asburiae]
MKRTLSVLLSIIPLTTIAATIPDGKPEKPFVIGNEVICLKEIQKDTIGLRLQINCVDSGLDVRVADLDNNWLQERGGMCQPAYMVLDRSQ